MRLLLSYSGGRFSFANRYNYEDTYSVLYENVWESNSQLDTTSFFNTLNDEIKIKIEDNIFACVRSSYYGMLAFEIVIDCDT